MVSSFQPSHVNPKTISYQNVPFNDESNLSVVFLFKACLAMWNVFGEYLHRWHCYNVAVYAECYENVTELQSLQEYLHRWRCCAQSIGRLFSKARLCIISKLIQDGTTLPHLSFLTTLPYHAITQQFGVHWVLAHILIQYSAMPWPANTAKLPNSGSR